MNVNPPSPLPCAVIGLGRIASSLEDDPYREKPCTHAGAIRAHPHTYICGGVDANPKKRLAFEKKWQAPTYPTWERLFAAQRPGIVHIATPPQSHLFYLQAGLDNQVPVLICEKPLAYDLKEAHNLVKRIADSPSKVIVNHERRFALDYNRAKKVIDSKQYGSLLSINAKLYLGRRRLLSDILWDDGTHLIDVLHFLSGHTFLVEAVGGRGLSRGPNLIARGHLGPVDVTLECGGGRDHLLFELDLSFAAGRILIGNGLYQEFASDVSPYYQGMRSLKEVSFIRFPQTKYFYAMMEEAVRAHTQPHFKPRSTVKDAFEVMQVIDAILSWSSKHR